MRGPLAAAGLLLLPAAFAAQQPPAQDCSGPEHRAFDFWVGEWEVTSSGRVAGTNSITLTQQGCILHEHWIGAGGGTGESFNFYDRTTGKWNQVWISNRGVVLRLSGIYAGGKMALEGQTKSSQGTVQHRITFFRNSDGTVRQFWEQSRDGGKTWTVAFDGLYRRK